MKKKDYSGGGKVFFIAFSGGAIFGAVIMGLIAAPKK